MFGLKDSEFQIKKSNTKNHTSQNNQVLVSPKARCSLADRLPSSKKLGKTIIIPQVAYDFGGIIPSSKVMESSHTF